MSKLITKTNWVKSKGFKIDHVTNMDNSFQGLSISGHSISECVLVEGNKVYKCFHYDDLIFPLEKTNTNYKVGDEANIYIKTNVETEFISN
jgi:hypothetical protein